MLSVILRRMKLWSPWGNWEKHIVNMKGCISEFMRVHRSNDIKSKFPSFVIVIGLGARVPEQISLLVIGFAGDFCLCRSGGSDFICLSQWRAANVALYVNATLFVHVLHMSITPCSNPSLRLGSGTSPPACVQGLAARVAVTVYNLQRACSLATCCFECVCIETIIKVLDIPALHMHAFITSDNRRLGFEWHTACHAR